MRELKKRTSVIVMAIFLAAALTAGVAVAKTLKCTVETVKSGVVTINCGDKADLLKPGDQIKVRPVVKRRAVEGC